MNSTQRLPKIFKTTDNIFVILFCILLLSFPWNNNVSSWAMVLFSVLILFRPLESLGLIFKKVATLCLISYYIYISLPYLFTFDFDAPYKVLVLSLPLLLISCILASRWVEVQKKREYFLMIFAIGVTVGFTVCLFYAFVKFRNEFYLFKNGYDPVTMLIGMHPAYLSLFVSFSFAIVTSCFIENFNKLSWSRRILFLIWIGYLVAATFYIRSRAGVGSLVILILFIIIYSAPKKYAFVYILSFVAVLGVTYLIIQVTSFHKGRFQIDQVNAEIHRKQMQWEAAINIILENPLFGVTTINEEKELVREYTMLGFDEGVLNKYNSHNQFLTTLVEGGILGFLLLYTPLLILLYSGLQRHDLVSLSFALLTTLAFLTESMLHRHKGMLFYAVFVTLLNIGLKIKGGEDQESGDLKINNIIS